MATTTPTAATLAVVEAYESASDKFAALAAVLRAAANQVGEWESAEELRAIATELDNL